MEGIDRNRGVTIRTDISTGAQVYMYKDLPGVFLNAFGTPVSDKIARSSGFDVKSLTHERDKRAAMRDSMEKIEAEYEQQNSAGHRKVIEQDHGFKLIQFPFGRHSVEDPEGNILNTKSLTGQEGKAFLRDMVDALAPNAEVVEDEPAKEADKEPEKTE